MNLKDKLGYNPLVIVDGGYSGQIYGTDKMALPIVKDEDFIERKDFNDEIINKFIEKAKDLEFVILNIDPEEYDMPLELRINRANVNYTTYLNKYKDLGDRASVYIALQYDPKACNWDDDDNSLLKMFYYNSDSLSKDLASLINKQFDYLSTSVKPSNNYLLRQLDMTSVLIDGSFLDLKKQVEWMRDSDFIEEVSDSILIGCLQFFGIKNIEAISTEINSNADKKIKKLQEKVDKLSKKVDSLEKQITDVDKFI
ncbi:hypothetical protein SH1V18_30560 [Vallitalea longa]|uniref:MurNAc-LAA domain-containing protein n=1 Tax=Vallitalea longa TaxID=2936439 RepID=A0A9W5YDB4_9FIRM|nr:N-acetylmuramoyl-L-alanine amidase [Vallitalea longa]GKX30576.1 hypothetical protein SH1V18_30560 [Vallitalea longa]